MNGKGPFLFLLDTGASGRARIDKSVVEHLKLPESGVKTGTTEAAKLETTLDRVAVDTLEFGGQHFRNVRSSMVDKKGQVTEYGY